MRTISFYRPVPAREQVWLREAVFKARKIGGLDTLVKQYKKGMKELEGVRHEAQRVRRKQLMYCIISYGFISILVLSSSYL
jgi:hypothetical protein